MNQSIVFGFAAILILGTLLFAFISKATNKNCSKRMDVEQYRVRWLAIEQRLKREEVLSYHLSVLNADKLVDQALRECGIRGETMGARLKSASAKFSDLDGLWTAHKLRNRVAHETDANVTYDEARYALGYFKKALKDLGAI
jgi:DNA-binding transcriptional ArsR family regulator